MRRIVLEAAARAAHECNRAFRIAHGEPYLLPHWEQLTDEDREICRRGVERVAEGWSARELHEGWVSDMTKAGWSYGDRRDVMGRKHPNLVGWDSLPPVEKEKDFLFEGVVKTVLLRLPERGRRA